MNIRFADAAHSARHCAGLTVETAAEILGIAPRTLAYYEAGRQVPDEIVAKMVGAYSAPELGYHWISRELCTGRLILPTIEAAGISSKALRLRLSFKHAAKVQGELEEICADDVISAHEKKPLGTCIGKIRELAAACMNISLLDKIQGKGKAAPTGVRHGSSYPKKDDLNSTIIAQEG